VVLSSNLFQDGFRKIDKKLSKVLLEPYLICLHPFNWIMRILGLDLLLVVSQKRTSQNR